METDSWLKQLWAFPSQPVTVWRRPFCEAFKTAGEWHMAGSHPHSESVPDPQRTSFSVRLLPRSSRLWRLYSVFLAAHITLVGKLCLFWNPLKTPSPYTPSVWHFISLGLVGAHLFIIPGRGISLLVYCPSSGHWAFPHRFTCFLLFFVWAGLACQHLLPVPPHLYEGGA